MALGAKGATIGTMEQQQTQDTGEGAAGGKKAAVVALVGRPSAGKSTFLNTACGQKALITSAYPQTTRNAIRAIVNRTAGQLVFIDTPGFHTSEQKMNRHLVKTAEGALEASDAVLYMVDATREPREEEEQAARIVLPFLQKCVVAVNKTDDKRADSNRAVAFITDAFGEGIGDRVVLVSAKTGKGVEDVLEALFDIADVGPALYPEDVYTDQAVDFRIAEIVRGQAIARLKDEIPHEIYVKVLDMQMKGSHLVVKAAICVERESQKGIVIGKGAGMIKAIREAAAKECRAVFPWKVDLQLQVRVDKNWRQNDKTLSTILG